MRAENYVYEFYESSYEIIFVLFKFTQISRNIVQYFYEWREAESETERVARSLTLCGNDDKDIDDNIIACSGKQIDRHSSLRIPVTTSSAKRRASCDNQRSWSRPFSSLCLRSGVHRQTGAQPVTYTYSARFTH